MKFFKKNKFSLDLLVLVNGKVVGKYRRARGYKHGIVQ